MSRIVAHCRIACSDSSIFVATQKEDEIERQSRDYVYKTIGKKCKPEDINCGICEIRKCAQGKEGWELALYLKYPCAMVSELHDTSSKARSTLNEIKCERCLA